MSKHTPGPWGVNCSHIYAPDGQIIATVRNPGSKVSDYPLVANRDLMASAPELLEALKLAKRHMEHMAGWIADQKAGYSFESLGEDMPSINSAIAKATGATE